MTAIPLTELFGEAVEPVRILIVNPTPALQHVYRFGKITHDQVNRAATCETLASGKGLNCARAAKAMHGEAVALVFSGGVTGECFSGLARDEGLTVVNILTASPTRTCTTLIEEESGTTTELIENAGPVTESEVRDFVREFDRFLPGCSALVCIGTVPPSCPVDLYSGMIGKARKLRIPTVVDTQREALLSAAAAQPTIVKPNRREILDLFDPAEDHDEAVHTNIDRLLELGAEHVLVTNGSREAWMCSKAGIIKRTPVPIRGRNPIGSGDSVAAALAIAMARGLPMCSDQGQDALSFALVAGALNAAGDGYGRLKRSGVVPGI